MKRVLIYSHDTFGLGSIRRMLEVIPQAATLELMLHHAQVDESDLGLLSRWLSQWTRRPHARWTPMRDLVERTALPGEQGRAQKRHQSQ